MRFFFWKFEIFTIIKDWTNKICITSCLLASGSGWWWQRWPEHQITDLNSVSLLIFKLPIWVTSSSDVIILYTLTSFTHIRSELWSLWMLDLSNKSTRVRRGREKVLNKEVRQQIGKERQTEIHHRTDEWRRGMTGNNELTDDWISELKMKMTCLYFTSTDNNSTSSQRSELFQPPWGGEKAADGVPKLIISFLIWSSWKQRLHLEAHERVCEGVVSRTVWHTHTHTHWRDLNVSVRTNIHEFGYFTGNSETESRRPHGFWVVSVWRQQLSACCCVIQVFMFLIKAWNFVNLLVSFGFKDKFNWVSPDRKSVV